MVGNAAAAALQAKTSVEAPLFGLSLFKGEFPFKGFLRALGSGFKVPWGFSGSGFRTGFFRLRVVKGSSKGSSEGSLEGLGPRSFGDSGAGLRASKV